MKKIRGDVWCTRRPFILHVKYWLDEDANVYVAYVPALKLYSQGETLNEAERAIRDAVESFSTVTTKLVG